MIGQMKVLLRVKDLKQDQAFRELQRRRAAVREAEEETRQAEAAVAESQRTMETREDAIFADILGRVVDLAEIDATHGRVVALVREHTVLTDTRERAVHVEARLRDEAETQSGVYQAAVKVRDKYTILTDDLVQARDAERAMAEEIEIEDMFSRPRKPVS
ncbi:type III secretion system stalk subunit SctO [Aureimonas jatrophae]|jgi:hypothetical protein|uniref:Type III secretion protein YscO n=1 Tax=Aureimonas jatrophae TaxID=1166073 RepID=A0A1H0ETN0_9HYPH|nr:YscO family type III secretion system apparatus protein [Aureimonas jatrophae]MBB3950320.1 hypothetical protein [Aureimonas jatrophae]SDN85705.1 Type III secretion protein YscO [Aureimonas jatrophae]